MGMPCILGKDGKLKVTLQEKIKIWKEYEEKLLNEENDWNKSMEITKDEGPCEQVSTEDVMEALILKNTGKAAGPSGVTLELLNVTSRIRSAWKKFKEVLNVICGRSISLKVRGTLYKSYVRNALTCGAECWALKVEDEWRLKPTEMRVLRMICEKTLKDKINNEKIREMTGVVRLEEFLREKRLRWLGHVERMDEKRGPVKALLLEVDGTKKGRPKKRWKEVLECDMTARGLQRLDAQDRERWRLGCKNQLTPACWEPLLGSRNRKKHNPGAK